MITVRVILVMLQCLSKLV